MHFIIHWIHQFGYFGIFSLLMFGIIGLPVPDETLMLFVGFLAYKHELALGYAIPAAFLGSVSGISASYLLGRTLGWYLVRRFGRYVFITPEKLDAAKHWFHRHGKWSLTLGYFFPGIRHLTAYVAGASSLEYPVFAIFAYVGALFWSSTFIVAGYLLGDTEKEVGRAIHHHLYLAGVCIIVILILFYLIKRWRTHAAERRRRSKSPS